MPRRPLLSACVVLLEIDAVQSEPLCIRKRVVVLVAAGASAVGLEYQLPIAVDFERSTLLRAGHQEIPRRRELMVTPNARIEVVRASVERNVDLVRERCDSHDATVVAAHPVIQEADRPVWFPVGVVLTAPRA